jgi:seryl-tRNA(Sec) selenium transferase
MQLFLQTQPELLKMGERIIKKLPSKKVESYGLDVIQSEVEAGSGSLPLEKFPSAAIVFNGDTKASELSQQFRTATPSVLGFINGNRFHIDLKAIPADQEGSLVQAMKNVLQ